MQHPGEPARHGASDTDVGLRDLEWLERLATRVTVGVYVGIVVLLLLRALLGGG